MATWCKIQFSEQRALYHAMPAKYTYDEIHESLLSYFKCQSVQAVQQDVYASRVLVDFRHRSVKQPRFVKNIPFFVLGPNLHQTTWQLLSHSRIFPQQSSTFHSKQIPNITLDEQVHICRRKTGWYIPSWGTLQQQSYGQATRHFEEVHLRATLNTNF